ncbi:metal-dependent hydrolase [Armatimonas rosea]|uniref:Inner membrane protein n=1 Tax=Armatimonas rosea TaxID=685828 RepID=A0A7W9W5R9_ARMRO|nr:metal-dependent hydrolase [Armatimonas rosea]MBB6050734.1 inner membrane protein [Armatimonas rosea]
MTWPTHLSGGIAAALMLGPLLGAESIAPTLLGAIVGALLPDLDADQSRLSNTYMFGSHPLRLPAQILHRALGHRGALHSFLGMMLFCSALGIPLLILGLGYVALGVTLGFLSHLLLDACTKSGVPLLWPDRTRLHLLPSWLLVTTGSKAEDVVFALLAAVNLYALVHIALTALDF